MDACHGRSYKLKFFQLLKNSFLMTFGLIFQNIFFVILMAIPVILILLALSSRWWASCS